MLPYKFLFLYNVYLNLLKCQGDVKCQGDGVIDNTANFKGVNNPFPLDTFKKDYRRGFSDGIRFLLMAMGD